MNETELLTAQSIPRDFRMVVVAGPDQGLSVPIDRTLLLGTSDHCDVKLNDRGVSRRHCILEPTGTSVLVRDEKSRNGTWHGSARLDQAEIQNGSELKVGESILRVEESEPTAPRPRPVRTEFGRFLGSARCLAPMYEVLELAARSEVNILLEGESGTGKELLAEALHEQSPRADGPFVVVDSGAVPETLIESELFGHEAGAFTGAQRMRRGAFEEADGGTLFLDEIGELPLHMQTRLLGVLERKRFKRVGGDKPIAVDVRVIAATNRNLEKEVEESRFRLDLFHRLAVALVRVPPLRKRREDVEQLALHFAQACRGRAGAELLTPEALARLAAHEWPGNVRELRNHVERLVIFGERAAFAGGSSTAKTAAPDETPSGDDIHAIIESACSGVPYRNARTAVLDAFTALYIERMLDRHGGSATEAAAAAGIARRHFHRLKSR